MTNTTLRGMTAALVLMAGLGTAVAQESTNVVATEGDWTVFAAENPKECWAVSPPKATQNTDANGAPREVTRGDIRLYVAYRPGQNGEVSFSGGYPFAPDSTVEVDIGGNKFNLFTEGESAWTGSASDDERLITALRGAAYGYYRKGLRGLERRGLLTLPVIPGYARSNYHIFHFLLESQDTRDRLLAFLKTCGVQATSHFVPLHSAPMGVSHCRTAGPLPVTEHAARCMVRLPLFANITRSEQDKVIEAVRAFFQG